MEFLFGIAFVLIFAIVISTFVVTAVREIKTRRNNNNSPRLTVDACVVSKRQNVGRSHSANAGDITGTHGYSDMNYTTYFVTFQVESGDRLELSVSGSEFGMLVEGDRGRLTFQGTRYLGFERQF